MKLEIGDKIIGRCWIYEWPQYGGSHYEYFQSTIINIEKTNVGIYYWIEPKCFRSGLWIEDILLKL